MLEIVEKYNFCREIQAGYFHAVKGVWSHDEDDHKALPRRCPKESNFFTNSWTRVINWALRGKPCINCFITHFQDFKFSVWILLHWSFLTAILSFAPWKSCPRTLLKFAPLVMKVCPLWLLKFMTNNFKFAWEILAHCCEKRALQFFRGSQICPLKFKYSRKFVDSLKIYFLKGSQICPFLENFPLSS